MDAGIREAFSKVREEMDEHLDAINQNTNELESCHEELAELAAKIERLSERLDELQLALEGAPRVSREISLSHREQEVFMVLYVREDPLTSLTIARRLGLTVEMVDRSLQGLIEKGVPVLRSFVDGKVYHSLDLKFKELQARRNVVGVSEAVSSQLVDERVF